MSFKVIKSGTNRKIVCDFTIEIRLLVGAHARGPAFSCVHCQHIQQSSSAPAAHRPSRLRRSLVFIARTDTRHDLPPAKLTVPSSKLGNIKQKCFCLCLMLVLCRRLKIALCIASRGNKTGKILK